MEQTVNILGACCYNMGWSDYGQSFQYAGNYGSRYTAIWKLSVPDFPGKGVLELKISASEFRPTGGQPVLRWALLRSDENRDKYIVPGAVEDDPHQLCSGTVRFTSTSQTLELETEVSGECYLIFWSYSTSYSYRVSLAPPENQQVILVYEDVYLLTVTEGLGTRLSVWRGEEEVYNGDPILHGEVLQVRCTYHDCVVPEETRVNGQPVGESFTVTGDTEVESFAHLPWLRLGPCRVQMFLERCPYAPFVGNELGVPVRMGE